MLSVFAPLPGRDGDWGAVVDRLKAAARDSGALDAAQIKFINLAEVRASSGPHWPAVRERILDRSLTVLRESVGADDIMLACADGFLVVFAHCAAEAAEQRAARIAEGLTAHFAGEEGLERLRARARRRRVCEREIHALAHNPPQPVRPTMEHERRSSLTLLPVWSIAAQTIVCRFATPVYCEQGIIRFGYDAAYRTAGAHNGEHYLHLDQAILAEALAQIGRTHVAGAAESQSDVVGACVHVTTLRRESSRRAYFDQLCAMDAAARGRLIIKIAEIEIGAPLSDLIRWTALLKQHARQVALEFHYAERAFIRVGETMAWAAGFQMPPPNAERGADEDVHETLRRWRQVLQRAGLRMFIDNVRSKPLLVAAGGLGVDFVASSLFWPPESALLKAVDTWSSGGRLAP